MQFNQKKTHTNLGINELIEKNPLIQKTYDLTNRLMQNISEKREEETKKIFVEVLKRKGYKFQSDNELYNFIKCNCSVSVIKKIHLYKAFGYCFLEWHPIDKMSIEETEDGIMCTGTIGEYRFV